MCAINDLHLACLRGDTHKLPGLLLGHDVNEKDPVNGYTAAHFACVEKNRDVMEILIEFHADLSLLGHDGRSCLHMASGNGGRANLVKLLLEHGARDVVNHANIEGDRPLHLASYYGKEDIVRLLLAAGADLDVLDGEGWSSLHRAAYQGRSDTVRLLLERGAIVETRSEDGYTPLFSSSYFGHLAVVRMLIHAGANPNNPFYETWSPLYAASQQGHCEVVKELLVAGKANVNKPHVYAQTALQAASEGGNLGTVLELLSAGADVYKCDADGNSALCYALKGGNAGVVSTLLKAGADVNQAGEDGETPLMRAKDLSCVRLLLDAGANPNATDADGYNSLHYAGMLGHPASVICFLFKAGCDARALTVADETPAYIARTCGNQDAAVLLEGLAEKAAIEALKYRVVSSAGIAATESSIDSVGSDASLEASGGAEPFANIEIENTVKVVDSTEIDALGDLIDSLDIMASADVTHETGISASANIESENPAKVGRKVGPCLHCGANTHRRCARCRTTYFCSLDCQLAVYAEHKGACLAIYEKKMESKACRC